MQAIKSLSKVQTNLIVHAIAEANETEEQKNCPHCHKHIFNNDIEENNHEIKDMTEEFLQLYFDMYKGKNGEPNIEFIDGGKRIISGYGHKPTKKMLTAPKILWLGLPFMQYKDAQDDELNSMLICKTTIGFFMRTDFGDNNQFTLIHHCPWCGRLLG